MATIDVSRFVTPEQDYSGLYRNAELLEREKLKEQELAYRREGKKAATASFLQNYLDPKDRLTGTNYDPLIVKGFDDLLQEGVKLAEKGADQNMLMMALSPQVAKLNQYSSTAKVVNDRLQKQLSVIPNNAGYDKAALEQKARQLAFYDEKGQLKDMSTLDPNTDWLTETVKHFPHLVTNDAGIDEFVKNSPKFSDTKTVKRVNSRGGYESRKTKVTAPAWMTVDDEGELVPKFEIAIDEGKPITHEFIGADGKKVSAPVRLLEEKEFDSLLASNHGIADWVRGQVMKDNPDIDINSPQAKIAARAIMYDELKRRKPGGMEDVEITKENPIHVHVPREGKQPTQIDLREYSDTPDGGKNITPMMGGFKVSVLPDGKSFTAEQVHYNPATKRVRYIEYVAKDEEGKYGKPQWKDVGITTFKQNIKALNPGTDMKFLDGLDSPVTGSSGKVDAPKQTTGSMGSAGGNVSFKKEISRNDIPAKAKAAGYSVKEYEAILKKNGVTIKD